MRCKETYESEKPHYNLQRTFASVFLNTDFRYWLSFLMLSLEILCYRRLDGFHVLSYWISLKVLWYLCKGCHYCLRGIMILHLLLLRCFPLLVWYFYGCDGMEEIVRFTKKSWNDLTAHWCRDTFSRSENEGWCDEFGRDSSPVRLDIFLNRLISELLEWRDKMANTHHDMLCYFLFCLFFVDSLLSFQIAKLTIFCKTLKKNDYLLWGFISKGRQYITMKLISGPKIIPANFENLFKTENARAGLG